MVKKYIDIYIWERELKTFLPEDIFDFHSHIFNIENFSKKLQKEGIFKKFCVYGGREEIYYNKLLFPGKKVRFLFAGFPYSGCDIRRQNDFVYRETQKLQGSKFFILTTPALEERYLKIWIEEKGTSGFKPYKCFSIKDPEKSRIADFLPYNQIEIANKYGLIITLHLSRKKGLADRYNFNDLLMLSDKYHSVKWNLAHCGRIFIPHYIEEIAYRLEELKNRNIYFDISAVCDSDIFSVFLSKIGPLKILFGSDNPIGLLRGRCVGLGYDWVFITEDKVPFDKMKESFGPVEPTFMIYEQLMCFRRAFTKAKLTKKDIQNIFYNNARKLLS
ncbi:MAG: amidohydrolase [Candidatus Omnitrophica bacterium]|nr:amidohydrolase [Candidatus Omnitrophota bacterium]